MLPIEHQNGFFNQFFYNVSEEPKSGNLTNMNLTNSTVKKIAIIFVVFLFACQAEKQASVKWVSSTFNNPWVNQHRIEADRDPKTSDIAVLAGNTFQQIEGFGTCFNELGWTSLSVLPDADREHIMQELFEPGKGAHSGASCGTQAGRADQRTDTLPCRPSGRRENIARTLDSPRHEPRVCACRSGRRAR